MKIDYEYISNILNTFLEASNPVMELSAFTDLMNEDGHKFFFHIVILAERGIISGTLSDPTKIGIEYNAKTNEYEYWSVPLRLTADGHDFANAINKPNIKEVIIGKFKEEGLSAVINIAKKLAVKYAENIFETL